MAISWTFANNSLKNRYKEASQKIDPNLFFIPDMPDLKIFEYLNWFAKNWRIANFAKLAFNHEHKEKVTFKKIASK